jgi:cytochrome c oxidase cbb3-type subunit 2
LGVPYSEVQIKGASAALNGKTEEDALIAYLQGLGTGVRKAALPQPSKAGAQQ